MSQPMLQVDKSAKEFSIGLVLGGGGARGIAHILVLEVFDELGLRPNEILGTSIGALFGAAYASGIPAADIREQAIGTLGKRIDILKKLFVQKREILLELWNLTPLSSSLMNSERLLEVVLPDTVSQFFSELLIPAKFVATDYYAQEPVLLQSGDLRQALAASIALPAIFAPVEINNRLLIDGGMTNPLPFDAVSGDINLTIAVDVTGGPVQRDNGAKPTPTDVLFAASQIQQNTIVKEKLKIRRPEILIRPPVDHIQVLAFYKIAEILEASAPIKDELKRALDFSLARKNQET